MIAAIGPALVTPLTLQRSAPADRDAAPSSGAQGPGDSARKPAQPTAQSTGNRGAEASGPSRELSETEQQLVDALRARDREVRDHEEAHARVGGEFAGEPSYSYQTGPDGRQYAVGGEVPIDVSPVPDDPEATIAKMDVVKRAALAPAEPSTADRRVAAEADAKRLAAMAELMALRSAEQSGQLVDLRL